MLRVGYKRTLTPDDMFVLDKDQKIEVIYERFMRILHQEAKNAVKREAKKERKKGNASPISEGPSEDLSEDTSEGIDAFSPVPPPATSLNPEDTHGNALAPARTTPFPLDPDSLQNLPVPLRTLMITVFKTFWVEYSIATIELLVTQVASTLMPLLQKKLTNFVEYKALGLPVQMGKGVGYAIGCCLLVLVIGVMINHFFYRSMLVGAKTKAVLTKVLLEKSFRLDAKGHHDFPTGKITSIMSTDLNRIDLALGFMPFLVIFPFPVIICVALLIVNIGVASLVGIAVFIVSSILMGASIKSLLGFRTKANKYTDLRVDLTKELLKNFKIIKFYSWEDSYRERLTETRGKEMGYVLGLQNVRNILTAFAMSLPTLSSAIAFCVLYALNSKRSVGDIFSSLTLFQVLSQQMMMFPMAIAVSTDFTVGLKRIAQFLSSGEVAVEGDPPEPLEDDKVALKVVDASFNWQTFEDKEDEEPADKKKDKKKCFKKEKQPQQQSEGTSDAVETSESSSTIEKSDLKSISDKPKFVGLRDVNFDVRKGEFVVVTGQIGSGKSSLLSALAGFMHREAGHVYCNGSLLLCGYPWVQNATVRDNITFGRPFDRHRYSEIVDACCLEDDFDLLPGGDNTEVGERGVTLSGGQKARINLARAVYADDDIILLDDVLSAVDAKVGKKIMEKCIMGLLADKTRILATHQLSLIGDADRMIFLNGDGSLDIGTVEELLARNDSFVKLMKFSSEKEDEEKDSKLAKRNKELQLQRIQTETVKDREEVFITKVEERAVNGIKLNVYMSYLRQGSGFFKHSYLPILVTSMILATFCSIFTNNWLSYWAADKFVGRSKSFYMGLYLMFAFLSIIFLTYEFWMLVYFANTAARRLNLLAMGRLLHTPMSYVDTTPMGRILNRFTKDTDVCDNELVEQYRMFINPFCMIAGTLILCIIYLPWFAIAVPPLTVVFVMISNYYQASAREVKRLEAVQRSFVFTHFSESLGGMDTVKAHRASHRFLEHMNGLVDNMNEAYFITIANQRWLSVNLDLVATAFSLIIALLCCFRVFNISAAATGLLLTYVLTIAGLFSFMLRSLTQIENEMNSVERLNHYAVDLVQEAPYEIPERDPAPEWPQQGRIVFDKVSLKYRPELPYVVKNVSLDIKPEERVGFCGRTGAGKSTIMSCMFRIVEFEGKIYIDGVDISTLGLHTLRKKLSIIPQDPVLFAGSIRQNLDPFHQKTDEELWDALRRSGLIEADMIGSVKRQKKGDEDLYKFHLDQYVEDDGINFSLGERQLLALARALVRECKVLILDEATSSVDYETDSKIQRTIATEFNDCTILCIAHRLKTILSYDRIVVLDKGEIKEFDKPLNLYENEDGIFRSMCDQSHITREDFN
ncbi:DEKNAAC103792 [Brettanomyces naardenensis]|uniref:DEKNAAC103792 n=1 Tax=Brettanomyces naardenensis TaxID=13370 RepID=A0A448YP84_BRENA|nr:DEKNAAC103792 [Brettanomyces naardenensis]